MYTLNITFPDYDSLRLYVERIGTTPKAQASTEEILKAAKKPVKERIQEGYEKATAHAVEAATKTTEEVGQVAEPNKSGTPSFADVKQAILDLAKAKGRNASLEVLKSFQDKNGAACEKVTAVKEADYVKLIADVQKVMS